MACACQTNKNRLKTTIDDSDIVVPHEITPGESCIFCAEKHIGAAVAASALNDLCTVIGDVELARRHTMYEYPVIASMLADIEFKLALRKAYIIQLENVFSMICDIASKTDQTARSNGIDEYTVNLSTQVNNPFIGEIHICAAYRLAFEIGYMIKNRAMIIGDMTFATEHLAHHCYDIAEGLRERRHRVQTMRAADINIYWPHVVHVVKEHIDNNLTAYTAEYADGLAKWLGVDPNAQASADK